MAGVAVGGERVVEPAHQLGRAAVDGRLVAEQPRLDADDEAERLDMAFQVGERKAPFATGFEIDELEPLEIAHHHVARALRLRQPGIVIERLLHRAGEVAARAFLFNDQRAGPEQVDEAAGAAGVERADALFVDRDLFARHAEDREKFVVEALRLALFIALAGPFLAEAGGVGADFGPWKGA